MSVHSIKVLIVEDSPVAAELLSYIIHLDPHLKVIGTVQNGEQALDFLKKQTPDVITMDIFMPKMDGFEATRRIMQTKPLPIVIISASYNKDDVSHSFRALEAGALAIFEKPKGILDPDFQRIVKEITTSLKMVSEIKLITRRMVASTSSATTPSHAKHFFSKQDRSVFNIEAVAIGASLGGPQALRTIITHLGPHFPVPIFIVQHISSGFTQGFVDWLSKESSLKIKLAQNHEIAQPDCIYVAPDQYHIEINKKNIVSLVEDSLQIGLKPSISRLFHSIAQTYEAHAIGVLLTGMGQDGANELLEMKKKGAITIAQDEESCLMYGMPKEAIAIGAASYVIPLSEIATTLKFLLKMDS